VALCSILDADNAATGNDKIHIGHVAPAFNLKGEQIMPHWFLDLKGMIVEVTATITHKVMNSDGGRSDNFLADLSYITVLGSAPPSPLSPLKKRGLYVPPHHFAKKR